MGSAEVEHLLSLRNAADHRSADGATLIEESEGRNRERLRRGSDQGHHAVEAEKVEVGHDVDVGGDRIHDDIEGVTCRLHLGIVTGVEEVMSTEAQRVLLLRLRVADHGDVCTHGDGELHAHVAETAKTHHADLHARPDEPLAQRVVEGDAGAEQRRRRVEGQVLRDVQDVALLAHDVGGVAAVSRGDAIALEAVVGRCVSAVEAVLLLADIAVFAVAARVDEAADAGMIADLELGDLAADGDDDARDLMAGHHREDRLAPLLETLMDVGVADAGELDVDGHVEGPELASGDGVRDERCAGSRYGVCAGFHVCPSSWGGCAVMRCRTGSRDGRA